ncbi:hypothetical protein KKC44_04635 [Patescibacteria group bacterium]|nr:hypothetical protein [Patescibacteria group bacterium]MBU2259864.1 hypothetical protein [Patescibacteria group bacterium]
MIRLGIETIGEATKYSADDFLDLMGFGKITLAEVCSKLSCLGLQLRESASREQPISLNLREKRKVIQDWRKGLLRMCRLNNACRAKPDDEQLHEEARQAREDFGEMSHMLFRCAGPGTGDALPIGDLENIGIQVGVGRLLNWVEVCPGGGDLESLAQIIRRRVNRAVEGTEALQTHPLDINTTTSASPRSLEGREIKLREQIERVLRTISYRERQILGLRLGLKDGYPYTLEDVGNIFETTRERIRQIEAKAIRKLHHGIRKNDLPVAAGLI